MIQEPPSPCTGVCLLDEATGWCVGCGRDIGEIAEWGSASPERRNEILQALPARLERLRARGRA
jgi:predicted Fe-S protein YdhL (DUF1289 family)